MRETHNHISLIVYFRSRIRNGMNTDLAESCFEKRKDEINKPE